MKSENADGVKMKHENRKTCKLWLKSKLIKVLKDGKVEEVQRGDK